jgi:hypothetical protein
LLKYFLNVDTLKKVAQMKKMLFRSFEVSQNELSLERSLTDATMFQQSIHKYIWSAAQWHESALRDMQMKCVQRALDLLAVQSNSNVTFYAQDFPLRVNSVCF